jgi:hypothetical protein
MQLDRTLTGAAEAERRLQEALEDLADRHADEADIFHTGRALARGCSEHLSALQPAAARYGARVAGPEPSASPGVIDAIGGDVPMVAVDAEVSGLGLLTDLRQTYLAAHEAEILWTTVLQGAKAARDRALIGGVEPAQEHAGRCATWLRTRIKAAAAQALIAG